VVLKVTKDICLQGTCLADPANTVGNGKRKIIMVLSMVLNYSKKGSFGVWEMAKLLESGETIGLTEWVI
jgi:hypothetical protein